MTTFSYVLLLDYYIYALLSRGITAAMPFLPAELRVIPPFTHLSYYSGRCKLVKTIVQSRLILIKDGVSTAPALTMK